MPRFNILLSLVLIHCALVACAQKPSKPPIRNEGKEKTALLLKVKRLQAENDSLRKLLNLPKSLPVIAEENALLGKDFSALIKQADSIFAYTVAPFVSELPTNAKDEIQKHKITARAGKICPADRKQLVAILMDKHNFEGPISSCVFVPGVAFELYAKEKVVQVLVCFSCDEWAFFLDGKKVQLSSYNARKDLLALVKPLFSKDAKIQALQ